MMKRLLIALLATVVASNALASVYSTTVSNDHPVHWYRLGESSGTVANDNGSSAVAGDYAGGFTLAQTGITGALPNTAVTFNGTTGAVSTNGSTGAFLPTAVSTAGWTFEAWGKTTLNATTQAIAGNNNTHGGWVVGFHSTNKFFFNTDQGGTSPCGTSTYGTTGTVGSWSTGNYYHVVATSIGAGSNTLTNMKIYVNGTLLATITSFTGTLCAGTEDVVTLAERAGGLFMTGTIDEAAFYQDAGGGAGALTQTQVTAHYNAGISTSGSGVWPFLTKRPEIPGFINNDYFEQAVSRGYNTGHLTSREIHPQILSVGWPNFAVMPWGNVGH